MKLTVADDIAQRIRDLRETLGRGDGGLLQEELARRAGVRASQISQWERGAQRPSRSRLERWAEREGWPTEIFQEGAPMPSTVFRELALQEEDPPSGMPTQEGKAPQEILASFYEVLASASRRGQPCPPELATLIQSMYDLAVATPRTDDPKSPDGPAQKENEGVPGW